MQRNVQLKEFREKDIKALLKESFELKKKLHELRFKTVFRNLKNVSEIRDTRKKIARVNTILNEKLNAELSQKDVK